MPSRGGGVRAAGPSLVARRRRAPSRVHPPASVGLGGGGQVSAPSEPGPPPVLSACGVHVTFPGQRGREPAWALDGVNLDVYPSEILALVGESGCGKTTLARTLLGLERP